MRAPRIGFASVEGEARASIYFAIDTFVAMRDKTRAESSDFHVQLQLHRMAMRVLDVYGDTGGVSSDQPVFLPTNLRFETCRNAEEDRGGGADAIAEG